ncbi:MAG: OmpH family outer membrane protein [Pseudomonadota bacterium]
MPLIRFALLALMICFATGPSLAQNAGVKVAILDVERIYLTASAARALKKDINTRSQPARDALAKRESQLVQENTQLSRQRSVLSQEVYAQKSQDLAQKLAQLERDSRDLRERQEDQLKKGLLEIQVVVKDVVQEIADEKGFDLVLANRVVMLQADTLDITQETLDRLDKKLPKITSAN